MVVPRWLSLKGGSLKAKLNGGLRVVKMNDGLGGLM